MNTGKKRRSNITKTRHPTYCFDLRGGDPARGGLQRAPPRSNIERLSYQFRNS
jgi:hypothetical protein